MVPRSAQDTGLFAGVIHSGARLSRHQQRALDEVMPDPDWPHWLVVGRIPEQEDSTLQFQAPNRRAAIARFVRHLYADGEAKRQDVKCIHGVTHYISTLISSATPITVHE
jgi:hypothetical protein